MKRTLPAWTDEQREAAERQRQVWADFFSSGQQRAAASTAVRGLDQSAAKLNAVLARNEAGLLRFPNVVAIATGVRVSKGKVTGEQCIVAYVSRKVPRSRLKKNQILPSRIDGVPVDVVEAGEIRPLPL
jgi:hypothetical protein